MTIFFALQSEKSPGNDQFLRFAKTGDNHFLRFAIRLVMTNFLGGTES